MIADLGCFTAYPGEFIGERERSLIALVRLCDRTSSVAGGFRSVLQTLQRVVERKAAGLLARREFLE